MNTKIIPPNFPNVEMFNVGHSEEELAVLKETAKWFNTLIDCRQGAVRWNCRVS